MCMSLRRLTLSLAAVASAAAAVSAPASAWEYFTANGRPGQVVMPAVFPFEDGRYSTYGPFLDVHDLRLALRLPQPRLER